MRFKDRVVLITGASSGIGEQAAYDFAREGARVILVARSLNKLEAIAERIMREYGREALPLQCDVSSKEQVKKVSALVLDKFMHLDILVNNAGFAIMGTVNDLSIEDLESQLATNLLGAIYCTKAFLPSMLERRDGKIINVASVAGSIGLPGFAAYCSSKFGMLGFSQGLYHELKGTGVSVTVVSPITVKTNFFNHASFAKVKNDFSLALNPSHVSKAILRAVNSRRLEIVVPSYVRGAIWLSQTLPYLVNPIIGSLFRRIVKT